MSTRKIEVAALAKTLVIVESPAKARTISKFLGRGYSVKASMGHVRDLPRSQFGVDVENDFTPKYITVRGQGKTLQELRKAAKKADRVLLATDPDREGEAISWHLLESLKIPESEAARIEFQEITKPAVRRALQSPRPLDKRLIDAQQARRVLDRIVGYKLSPLLWAKVRKGLSAGRVQSVALRLICDREDEIESFVPQEYWSLTAALETSGSKGRFEAKLIEVQGKKAEIATEEAMQEVVAALDGAEFRVKEIRRRQRRRNPAPPFTTSTLQQEAARRLGFTARKTMSLAQELYEGLDVGEGAVGLITYLRTDATRVAAEAQQEARSYVVAQHGAEFVPKRPPEYKSRAGAQAAHEAIRPTSVARTPEALKPYLKRDQLRLYRLIWERFVASQMAPAVYDTVSIDIEAKDCVFRATGQSLRFAGFTAVYTERTDEPASEEEAQADLPPMEEGDVLRCQALTPKQHFTQPPPRFTEAMLVKTLEELGIGRPSTYVSIIDTIVRRGYVVREDRRFFPTELGRLIVDLLKANFPDIVDVEFTANLEEKLDQIEEGRVEWTRVLREFYEPFAGAVAKAHQQIDNVEIPDETTDEICEQCGRNLVIKWGRFGRFLACPGFPECRFTKPLLKPVGVDCPKCGAGAIVERRSRKGRVFYGCDRYPECDLTLWQRPVNKRCPRCNSLLVEKRQRGRALQWICSEKTCGHSQDPDESPAESGARAEQAL